MLISSLRRTLALTVAAAIFTFAVRPAAADSVASYAVTGTSGGQTVNGTATFIYSNGQFDINMSGGLATAILSGLQFNVTTLNQLPTAPTPASNAVNYDFELKSTSGSSAIFNVNVSSLTNTSTISNVDLIFGGTTYASSVGFIPSTVTSTSPHLSASSVPLPEAASTGLSLLLGLGALKLWRNRFSVAAPVQ